MLQKFSSLLTKIPVQIRSFMAVPQKVEQNDLLIMLNKEIKIQNQQLSEGNSIDTAIKSMEKLGFNQIPSKNLLSVCMQKKVKDKTITLYSDYNMIMNRPPDMEEEETNPAKEKGKEEEDQPIETMVGYIATLSKENEAKGLIVELLVNDTGIEVGGVRHTNEVQKDTKYIIENGKTPEDLYGPSFDRLDERLQTGMTDYFVSLGITEEVLSTLFDMLNKKEEKLYGDWLNKVSAFVA